VSELRLTGGRFRGRRLRVPHGVRPTEGRLREALFSIWQGEIEGARFLDLFAGAGGVGLEAVGRGAARAVLVEGDPRTLRTLRENVAALAAEGATRLYRLRLPAGLAVLREHEPPFHLAYVDPPYGFADAARLLAAVAPLLAPGASVCFEHADRDAVPPGAAGLVPTATRCYGGSCLSFYRVAAPGAPEGSAERAPAAG
jgi:16S rRNA (guanine966-N2)-methyltransferase